MADDGYSFIRHPSSISSRLPPRTYNSVISTVASLADVDDLREWATQLSEAAVERRILEGPQEHARVERREVSRG